DPIEGRQGLIDDCLCSLWLCKIGVDDKRFRAGGSHRLRGPFQIGAVSRDQDQRGEVARKADRGSPPYALACSRDDGDRLRHQRSPSVKRMESEGKEVAYGRGDLGCVGLQREMPGVEEADDGVGNVALERL